MDERAKSEYPSLVQPLTELDESPHHDGEQERERATYRITSQSNKTGLTWRS